MYYNVTGCILFKYMPLIMCYQIKCRYKKRPLLITKFVDETPPESIAESTEISNDPPPEVENVGLLEDIALKLVN